MAAKKADGATAGRTMRKGNAVALTRTPAQKAAATRAEKQALEKANAVRLAQIVNLHIAGHSLAEIGAAIGASEDEVDRLLAQDAQRYVRSQPALRTYVRNYISEKYTKLLDTVWDRATDKTHKENFEAFDRAERILRDMERLHGATAPTQVEVAVDTAPEAVEKLVTALSRAQGLDYDTDIFDVEVIEEAVHESEQRLADSAEMVGEGPEDAL